MTENTKYYPNVDANPDFPKIEERILESWKNEGTFAASVAARAPQTADGANNEFIFYDGPPFANGLPHYGHLLTGFVKDLFARYQTMQGKRVERRFGWDCHGLPAELGSEKELGISGRQAITKFGIGRFNEHCRTSVMKYTHEWEYYVTRQARWVDFAGDYKTMDKNYMESVIWAFKQLYDKGLVYEAYRVMPYSWAAETPLSNFETRLDNSYRERVDKAITIAFELAKVPEKLIEAVPVLARCRTFKVLAWTTTPWTLPSNLALAVGKDIKYTAICVDDTCYIAAIAQTPLLQQIAGQGGKALVTDELHPGSAETVGEFPGSVLVGLSYKPLFPYFEKHQPGRTFRILDGSDFVTDTDGTGVVHMAPGFGEDDQRVCEANGISLVCPVDMAGRFTDEIYDLPELSLKGMNVIEENVAEYKFGEANERIIEWLKKHGQLIKQEQITHNYPHCWRTDKPLIYRAVSSWYVEVTKFRDRAVELNQKINWIPEHVKDGQMGHMLATAPDWSISRNRFWGTPIPLWKSKSGKIKVFGSIAELEAASGQKVPDLHRPYIDEIVITENGEEYRRVEDVFDCWFESGSMPFAQVHYPFENKEWFEHHFPADFITEYVGQTRGWFNTLIMLSTALFDRPPFLNCICHGVVLDAETGLKYSKRLKNYKDPREVMDQFGADALRWLMLSSPVMRGQDLSVDPEGKFIRDMVRLAIKPIWNAYNFFCLYANADGIKAAFKTDSKDIMDRYILAKCNQAVAAIAKALDGYDTPGATEAVTQFFEALNNWYIRRSKERFWKSECDEDKISAYNTLYTVLHIMCRAAAPLLPLTLEEIYRGLTGEKSVHLADFPAYAQTSKEQSDAIRRMDQIRDICNAALAIRNARNLRVRLPLAALKIVSAEGNFSEEELNIIRDEVNIKDVGYDSNLTQYAAFKLQIHFPVLGKRLPEKMKQIIPASKKGDWKLLEDGRVEIIGEPLEKNEFSLLLEPKPDYKDNAQPLSTNDALILLDTHITPELEAEGYARDIVRLVQEARKRAGLNVTDRINLRLRVADKLAPALQNHSHYIADQVLAASLEQGDMQGCTYIANDMVEAHEVSIGFAVAA
ncbi:MAG TPA: isoleucine--tRNA ligase [Rickettsiales bacterium]|nr:isoleucine--tRNA ligase [Rickettsiales bacterium]